MANFNLTRDYRVPPKTEAEKKAADEAYNRAVNGLIKKSEEENYSPIHNVYDGVDVAYSPNSTGAQVGGGRPVKLEELADALGGMDDAQKQKLLKFVGMLDAALGGVKISVEQKDADGNVVPYKGDDATECAEDAAEDSGDLHAGDLTGSRRKLGRVMFANMFGAAFGKVKTGGAAHASDDTRVLAEVAETPHADDAGGTTESAGGAQYGGDRSETVDDVAVNDVRPTQAEVRSVHTGLLWCCRRETYTCRTAAGVVFVIEALFREDNPPKFANCVYADTYAEIKAKANTAYEAWNKHFAVVKACGGDEQNGTLLGIFNTWDDANKYVRAAKVKGGVRAGCDDADVFGGGAEQVSSDDGSTDWLEIDGGSSIFVVPYTAFRAKVATESERDCDTAGFAETFIKAKRAFADGRDTAREYYAIGVQESAKRGTPCFTVLDKVTGMRVRDEQF